LDGDTLIFETAKQSVEVYGRNVEPTETPHANLVLAWEVISHPYVTGAIYRSNVENGIKVKAQALGHTITLDHNESRFLDAMAEACGIPTVYGQVTVAGKTPQTFDIRKKDAAP
jgi:cobalamin biosynthesis protein CbiG